MNNFENEKKVKKIKGLIVLLFIVIICLGILTYYLLRISEPKKIFESKINELLSCIIEDNNYKTAKITTNVSAQINSKDKEIEKIADIISDVKLTMLSEVDIEENESYVGIDFSKDSTNLFDANLKYEENTKCVYADLGELFDKIIKIELNDVVGDDEEIENINVSSFGQMKDSIKAREIIGNEIKKQIKDEYFSKEKVDVDGKKFIKNEMKVSEKDFSNIAKNIITDLSENDEFLSCYKDKENVKESFKKAIEEYDDSSLDENLYIIIDIYTSGIMKDIKRIDFSVCDEEYNATIQITKTDDDIYNYKIIKNDEINGEGELKIKIENNEFNLQILVKNEEDEYILKVDGNVVYDEKIDTIKTENAVDFNDLSMEEISQIIDNFSKSKLFELFENVSDSESYNYGIDENDI